ncbi:MAG: DUF3151 family protein [Actinomycetes bacterium]
MSDAPVHLTPSGPPETVLPPLPDDLAGSLAAALELDPPERRAELARLVAAAPRSIDCWARLGEVGRDPIERYAYFRIGYHRGLDLLRASGWRGSGYVRWAHASNRGFLRALDGLRATAAVIGETDEVERCDLFLRQLDPEWAGSDVVVASEVSGE